MSFAENFTTNSENIILMIEKNLPKILQIFGTIAVTGGAIWACKNTVKAVGIMEEHHEMAEDLEDAIEQSRGCDAEDADLYSEDAYNKDKKALYIQTTGRLAKTYALPVLTFTAGVVALNIGQAVLEDRLATMTGAYVGLRTIFDKYRKRVIEDYGEETDYDYLHGLKTCERTVKDENGKKVKEKYKEVVDDELYMTLARFYDSSNLNYEEGSNDYNMIQLFNWQEECNRRLRAQGHLFLNEVYDILGFKRTSLGQKYGWIWDGETKVDFGLLNGKSEATRRYKNGEEVEAILLYFNVTGPILDLI